MDTTVPQTRTLNANRIRRALDLGFNGVFWTIFVVVVFLAYGSVPNHFYQVLMVNSGSMSPTIEAGDLIVVTKPPEELRPGMVLTMMVNGGIVTHRLVDIAADGQLITRGDANEVNDQWDSSDISVRGLYRFRIPRLGLLLNGPMQWLRGTVTGSWFTDADAVTFSIGAGWATQEPPAGPGCTYTLGYWKNHVDQWPVDQLTIGGRLYSKSDLLGLLNTSTGGDPTIILVQQFIAALLNVENGADPSAVAATLTAADVYLAQYPPGSNPSDRSGVNLAETLDQFNNGLIGPGHCDGNQDPEPTKTVPNVPPINPGCAHSQRYWLEHADDWPLTGMTIGAQAYSKEELLALLDIDSQNSVTVVLAQQYITARLNVENGTDPAEIEDTLEAVEGLFALHAPGSDPNDNDARQQCRDLAKVLDRYNTGKLGPAKCSNEKEAAEPASRLVDLVTRTPTPTVTEPIPEPRSESFQEITPTPTPTVEPSPTPTESVEPPDEQPALTLGPTATDTPEPTATIPPTATPLPPTETPEPDTTDEPSPTEESGGQPTLESGSEDPAASD